MLSLPLRYVRPTTILSGMALGGASYATIKSVHAESESPAKAFGRGLSMVSLPLESSEKVNHDTKLLRFKLPNETDVSGLSLTSAVLTASWPQGRWLPVARPYTPVSASNEPGRLDLLVKHHTNGKQSTHLHALKPGDSLLFAAALPGFKWTPNTTSNVTLIAGGSGITPIYQLAQGILRNPDDRTAVTLIYATNTEEDILLKKQFDSFEQDFPGRFKAVYTVSKPAQGSKLHEGRVSKQLLERVLSPLPSNGDMVFLCGPPAMETALRGDRKSKGVLEELGYRKDQVHSF